MRRLVLAGVAIVGLAALSACGNSACDDLKAQAAKLAEEAQKLTADTTAAGTDQAKLAEIQKRAQELATKGTDLSAKLVAEKCS
jgi:hypothetical protein